MLSKRKPGSSAVPPGNTAPQAGNDRGYAIASCIPVNESFGRHTNKAGIQVALNHLRWCPPLRQVQHLKKKFKLWEPTWQKEVGWSPEATDARLRKGISFVWTTA